MKISELITKLQEKREVIKSERELYKTLSNEEKQYLRRIKALKKLSAKEYQELRKENVELLREYISAIDPVIAENINNDELDEYVNALMNNYELIRSAIYIYQEKSFTNAPLDDQRVLSFMRLYELE